MHRRASQRYCAGANRIECENHNHTVRTIDAESFWAVKVLSNTVLAPGEIITQIQIPVPPAGTKSAFIKFAIRKSIDFPIVNCAVMVGADAPRICLKAVAPKPYRATQAEAAIAGKPINEVNAEAAVADARPLQALDHVKSGCLPLPKESQSHMSVAVRGIPAPLFPAAHNFG